MRLEKEFINFVDEFAASPLPLTREGSARASVRIDMEYSSDGSFSGDEFSNESSLTEQEEGRLSRSLQTWMPDHILRTLEPRDKPPLEPVYSGKLGKERTVVPTLKQVRTTKNRRKTGCKSAPLRRVASDESLVTNLSLLSCSSGESHVTLEADLNKDKRRRRRKLASRASTLTENGTSKWVELANKKRGVLDMFMRAHAATRNVDFGFVCGDEYDNESEAFRLMDKDEQKALFDAGMRRGIRYVNKQTLKRSSSITEIKEEVRKPRAALRRVLSANAKQYRGKPLDFAEIKRERMNRLIAIEQAKQKEREHRHKKGRKSSLIRSSSNKSLSTASHGRPSSPSLSTVHSISTHSVSGHSSDMRPYSPTSKAESNTDEPITIWKGDRQILEIDLNRELTHRVKGRITKTQSALKRATGMGETNDIKIIVGTYDEFPKHTDDDFCQKPKIIQKIRISPQLSGVIHEDIQVRMGRPRYHEIRIADIKQWDKGQRLDKAHRNLKVFNWLHSLRENAFVYNTIPVIDDDLPNEETVNDIELLHVESADEPDLKPLYRAYEVRML